MGTKGVGRRPPPRPVTASTAAMANANRPRTSDCRASMPTNPVTSSRRTVGSWSGAGPMPITLGDQAVPPWAVMSWRPGVRTSSRPSTARSSNSSSRPSIPTGSTGTRTPSGWVAVGLVGAGGEPGRRGTARAVGLEAVEVVRAPLQDHVLPSGYGDPDHQPLAGPLAAALDRAHGVSRRHERPRQHQEGQHHEHHPGDQGGAGTAGPGPGRCGGSGVGRRERLSRSGHRRGPTTRAYGSGVLRRPAAMARRASLSESRWAIAWRLS